MKAPAPRAELKPLRGNIGWADDRMVESFTMLITTGQVQNGAIEVDKSTLPEGAKVTILFHEDDETFEVTSEEEARLLAAIAEADRGIHGQA